MVRGEAWTVVGGKAWLEARQDGRRGQGMVGGKARSEARHVRYFDVEAPSHLKRSDATNGTLPHLKTN